MILYFLDRDMQVIGVASTHQPGTHHITDDRMTDELSASVKTLEFDLIYRFAERQNADLCTTPGNYILRERDGAYNEFMIVDSEEDTEKNRINVYAEDAGMGLVNRTIGRFVPSGPSKITDYIGAWLEGTGFEIGVNEIPNVEKYVYWTSEDRATDRIRECAKKFGAEIEYSFEIDRLRIAHKYLNIYARRGPVTYRTLRVGVEIGGITKARSSADVVTGIIPNGNTDEGDDDPVTLSGYTYDDGEYYITDGSLLSRSAYAKWCRGDQGHILIEKHYDADTQQRLFDLAIADLKERIDIKTTWTAELNSFPKGLSTGEAVRVLDERRGICFTARVIALTDSETRSRTTAELGEAQEV